jgi:hypothetical protein
MTRLGVFTDANVLYGSTLRDLLLQLGVDKIVSLRWTEAVHLEWSQALVRSRPDLADRVERTRGIMLDALPEALVLDYEHRVDDLDLPDPNDRHVLAAALESGAQLILTSNLRHFPAEAMPAGVAAIHPDTLLSLLLAADPAPVLAAISKVRHRMAKPPMSPAEFLDALRHALLPLTARALESFQDQI